MFEWVINASGNSYKDMVYGIKTVSNIITSSEFSALLTIAIIIAVVVALIYTALVSFYQHKITHTWVLNAFIGVIFVIAVVKPEGKVIISDIDETSPTFGQITSLNNVPFAVGFPAFFLSQAEKSITSMVKKYGAPIMSISDYNKIGGELSYSLLLNMQGLPGSVEKVKPDLYKNMKTYMGRCVDVAIAMEHINLEDLQKPKASTLWEKIYVQKAIPIKGLVDDKTIETCPQLYDKLNTDFFNNSDDIMEDYCSANGYVGSSYSLTSCKEVLGKIFGVYFNKNEI
jgi:hypothetical protein